MKSLNTNVTNVYAGMVTRENKMKLPCLKCIGTQTLISIDGFSSAKDSKE